MGVVTYVPNLIGYVRVLTALGAISYALQPGGYVNAMILYCLSQGLDAVDGVAARWLNQCSTFGAVLDMVTDRVSTAALLLVLSHLYAAQYFAFALLLILDISSHWCQMYSTLLKGSQSHKVSAEAEDENFLLQFYYSFPYALFTVCAGSEGFLVGLYLLKFTAGATLSFVGMPWVVAFTYACFPVFVLKQIISVVQLLCALGSIVEHDNRKRR